jgi:hypothetical protein
MFKLRQLDENEKDLFVNVKTKTDGIMVKKFLTVKEAQNITCILLSQKHTLGRKITLICKLIEYCTNIDLSDFTDDNGDINGEKLYDELVTYDFQLHEYLLYGIDNLQWLVLDSVEQIESVDNRIESLINAINKLQLDFNNYNNKTIVDCSANEIEEGVSND